MLSSLFLAVLLSSPGVSAEATSRDAWAVGGSSFGGAVLGTAGGFGAGIGIASVACSAGGNPDGAWGCILLTSSIGAVLGGGAGGVGAGTWIAKRRGLDSHLVRRRSLLTAGISYGLMATVVGAPLGAVGLLAAVPIVAGRAVTHPRELTVAPLIGRDAQGVALSARF